MIIAPGSALKCIVFVKVEDLVRSHLLRGSEHHWLWLEVYSARWALILDHIGLVSADIASPLARLVLVTLIFTAYRHVQHDLRAEWVLKRWDRPQIDRYCSNGRNLEFIAGRVRRGSVQILTLLVS